MSHLLTWLILARVGPAGSWGGRRPSGLILGTGGSPGAAANETASGPPRPLQSTVPLNDRLGVVAAGGLESAADTGSSHLR